MTIEGFPYATLPDLDSPLSLECLFSIGAEGSGNEQPIDALFAAVGATTPGLNTGCNAGFYRPKAFLTVILLTDEDDDDNDAQGNDGSEEIFENLWKNTLASLKPTTYNDLYMVGVFGDPDPAMTSCPWTPLQGDDGFGHAASGCGRRCPTRIGRDPRSAHPPSADHTRFPDRSCRSYQPCT